MLDPILMHPLERFVVDTISQIDGLATDIQKGHHVDASVAQLSDVARAETEVVRRSDAGLGAHMWNTIGSFLSDASQSNGSLALRPLQQAREGLVQLASDMRFDTRLTDAESTALRGVIPS
jgi:hypothetical protein